MPTPWSRASQAFWAAKPRPTDLGQLRGPIARANCPAPSQAVPACIVTGRLALEFLLQVGQHLGLNLLQPKRRERLLEESLHPTGTRPRGGDGDTRTRSRGSHRPVGDHRRIGIL